MFPKISQKNYHSIQNLYPKLNTNNKSDKENNITRLKKLRQFLDCKSPQIDEYQSIKGKQNVSVTLSINYDSINTSSSVSVHVQDLQRYKDNTSAVRRKKKKVWNQLQLNIPIQKKITNNKQKIRLNQILNYSTHKQKQQVPTIFSKCKLL